MRKTQSFLWLPARNTHPLALDNRGVNHHHLFPYDNKYSTPRITYITVLQSLSLADQGSVLNPHRDGAKSTSPRENRLPTVRITTGNSVCAIQRLQFCSPTGSRRSNHGFTEAESRAALMERERGRGIG